MGDSTMWLAFRGLERTNVLERLNLQPATEPDPVIFGGALPDGWYLLLGRGLQFMDDAIMNRACAHSVGVSCYLEEHIMVSGVAGWERGRRVWSVVHDGEQGINDLEVEGELPAAYAAIHHGLTAKQQAAGPRPKVDYIYDIPTELAAAVTGFHHTRGTRAGYPDLEPLEVAELPTAAAEPWLQPARPESWFTKYCG